MSSSNTDFHSWIEIEPSLDDGAQHHTQNSKNLLSLLEAQSDCFASGQIGE